ncbi:MAG: hypothetical protein KF889_25500 [Alphaproteobacteria bacterium]|nr:hypothetical protein [Alphaproteobacteria bacterium]MCW5739649.1 hypothetical protein [Alphaproteobacteria bacterium]
MQALSTRSFGEGATEARDKSQAEVIVDRLRMTASMMQQHNGAMTMSLDRLCGASPGKDVGSAQAPTPADFVGLANALLDEIARELDRMQGNAARLSRVA